MPPMTGSGCPEIDALPEFLQDIPRELYQLSLTEDHTKIFREACKRLKEIIPEAECPYRPHTIAWRLWFRGLTRGFIDSYVSAVVNEEAAGSRSSRLDIAQTMLNNGFDRNTVMKMIGLTEEDLAQIRH